MLLYDLFARGKKSSLTITVIARIANPKFPK